MFNKNIIICTNIWNFIKLSWVSIFTNFVKTFFKVFRFLPYFTYLFKLLGNHRNKVQYIKIVSLQTIYNNIVSVENCAYSLDSFVLVLYFHVLMMMYHLAVFKFLLPVFHLSLKMISNCIQILQEYINDFLHLLPVL